MGSIFRIAIKDLLIQVLNIVFIKNDILQMLYWLLPFCGLLLFYGIALPIFFDASSNSLLNFAVMLRPGRDLLAVNNQLMASVVPTFRVNF